ncbi:MAG: Uncharacterized protein XD78_1341 [Desulfotomaculum sp. 46_296]|nr:MAG: Uncharacterized protein XD78_1341 [Desulfotomaculum sp. 46_296]
MNRLCFGTYAKVLQGVMQEPNDNQAIADILLGLLTDNEQVIPKVVSQLFNFKQEVPKAIIAEASSPRVVQGAYKYFNEKIAAFLNPHNKDELLPLMTQLIKDESTITDEKKNALLCKSRESSLGEFLADTFLYAIYRPNKLPTDDAGMEISELVPVLDNIAKLQDLLSSIPRPVALVMPEELEADELTYVTELLEAYADAEKIADLPKESLDKYPKYKNDFSRRRKDYYAAETIRRASRDIFGDIDPDQFIILKDETYDGIIDVHSQDFPHGVARLNAVMSQAAVIRVNKCMLSRIPDWIGASEKKGVCHILVNDRRIKGWVSDE